MSQIAGMEATHARLAAFDKALSAGMEQRLDEDVAFLRETTAALAPVRRGRLRRAFGSPESVIKQVDKDTGTMTWTYGLVTEALAREAFHALWIERGNKGYDAGAKRRAGKDKQGRQRERTIKRRVPARHARPFIGPAFAIFKARRAQSQGAAAAVAAARVVSGF